MPNDNAFIINKEFFFSDVESVFEEFNIPQMRSYLILCQEVLRHLNESFSDIPCFHYPVTIEYLSKVILYLDKLYSSDEENKLTSAAGSL